MLTFLFYGLVILCSYLLQRTFGFAYSNTVFYTDTLLFFLIAGFISFVPEKIRNYLFILLSIFYSTGCFLFYVAFKETQQLLSITFIQELTKDAFSHYEAYLFFLLIPIVIYLCKNYKSYHWGTFVIALVAFNILYPNVKDIDIGRLEKQWNREYVVEKYGYSLYCISDLAFNIPRNFAGYDEVEVPEKEHTDNEYTNLLKGQNLIVIHAESMEQFLIGATVNGQEITPFLNRLSKESIYFDNFYSEVSLGTSSDSEITFNTGLLPSQTGCTSINYFNKIQNALPSLLKDEGYYTISFHANNGNFWNRKFFHQYLGNMEFVSMEDLEINETIGLGLSDFSFIDQVMERLDQIDGPFMSTVITLTNHTPFRGLEATNTLDLEDVSATARYLRYFQTVHYADSVLEYFFLQLEEKGYLENTTIVLYGDHGASLGTEEQNQKVPFMIYSKSLTPEVNHKLGGMCDALPTIANMFGLKTAYTTGNDLMSDSEGCVLFVDGNYLGTPSRDVEELLKINEYVVRTRS